MPTAINVTLEEYMRKYVSTRLARVLTWLPGVVIEYDPATRLATVQPQIRRQVNGRTEDRLAIPGIRVDMPRGNGFDISLPVAAGDTGRIVFCARGLGGWHDTGRMVDPDGNIHEYQDAVFVPGLCHDQNVPAGGSATDMILRKSDGSAEVRIAPDGTVTVKGVMVKLGDGSATQLVALDSLVAAQLNVLKAAITAAPVVPLDGGAAFKAALIAALASWPATMAATKVKAI